MKFFGSNVLYLFLCWSCIAKQVSSFYSLKFYKYGISDNRKQFASSRTVTRLKREQNYCKRGAIRKQLRLSARKKSLLFENNNDEEESSNNYYTDKWKSRESSFILLKNIGRQSRRRRKLLRRLFSRRKESEDTNIEMMQQQLNVSYSFDELIIEATQREGDDNLLNSTVGIVLIHPIGVGIGRWFHQRLLDALSKQQTINGFNSFRRLLILSPDLLGSGSGCNPTTTSGSDDDIVDLKKLPLLNISDWTGQLQHLMEETEQSTNIDRWCIVANGGCSPIALQIAQRSVESTAPFQRKVTNVILSSVPRLPFFFSSTDPEKVAKSYKTLCGLVGKLFWWYSCRNRGAFIQKFSEKNLVADPKNLGDKWRINCYDTARINGGKSKYSTFAFLAGILQDGCSKSLLALKNSDVKVDIIKGKDVRKNRARSWFWQKKKKEKVEEVVVPPSKTLRDFLVENGNGGREALIEGRISLAHEDAQGYSNALIQFIDSDN